MSSVEPQDNDRGDFARLQGCHPSIEESEVEDLNHSGLYMKLGEVEPEVWAG
jgi:hypothetical protein